jgi:hypothetical protein
LYIDHQIFFCLYKVYVVAELAMPAQTFKNTCELTALSLSTYHNATMSLLTTAGC